MSTILLITNPRYIGDKLLILSNRSRVFVDPPVAAATELQVFFRRQVPKYHTAYTDSELARVFQHQDPENLTTLEELGSLISQDPTIIHTARVSVLFGSVDLYPLWFNDRLFYYNCTSCPNGGYSNTHWDHCECGSGDMKVVSRINPHCIQGFSDETCGFVCSPMSGWQSIHDPHRLTTALTWVTDAAMHPLVVTDVAFLAMTGRTPMDLCDRLQLLSEEELVAELIGLEDRLTCKRVVFKLGWTGDKWMKGVPTKLETGNAEKANSWTSLGRLVLLDVEGDFPHQT